MPSQAASEGYLCEMLDRNIPRYPMDVDSVSKRSSRPDLLLKPDLRSSLRRYA
jgi:hypothetical protein